MGPSELFGSAISPAKARVTVDQPGCLVYRGRMWTDAVSNLPLPLFTGSADQEQEHR